MSSHPIIEVLRWARIEKRMSRLKCAKIAHMPRGTLTKWEDEKCSALATLDRWAASLGYRLTLVPLKQRVTDSEAPARGRD